MSELSEELQEQIEDLKLEGDFLSDDGEYSDALKQYWAAWDLLPEPQKEYEEATELLEAIGSTNFSAGDYEAGRDNLSRAMHCPGAIGNPYIHLRLGQCQYELGNEERAADELARAYMGEGYLLFEHEEPKYFEFLKSKLDPPPGGWEDEPKKPWWKFW